MGRLVEFLRHLSPSERASVKAAEKDRQEKAQQEKNREYQEKINQEMHALNHRQFELGCQAIEQLEIQKKLEAIFRSKTDQEYKIYQEPRKDENDPFFSSLKPARITIAILPPKQSEDVKTDNPPERFKTLHVYGSVIINNDGAIFPELRMRDGESIDTETLQNQDYNYKSLFIMKTLGIRPVYIPNKIKDLGKDFSANIKKEIKIEITPEIEAQTNVILEEAVGLFLNPPKNP